MTDVRDVAAPVLVVDTLKLRAQLSLGLADALRGEPGVDIVGVGANQARPTIRGQRGQRILLLADGMRINNSRRQQDFGEIPALVDLGRVSRIEVVRGPASVLYGTDAIGGVINVITREPSFDDTERVSGRVSYLYGGAGDVNKASVAITGRARTLAYDLFGTVRSAGDYSAPAGSYGKVSLADDQRVQHSGVRDRNAAASLAWRASDRGRLFARYERYAADDAGFGYVPPGTIGGNPTEIEILYPRQDFWKGAAGLNASTPGARLADRFDFVVYSQRNMRDLTQRIFALFGPGTPPGAGVGINTANYTDITSRGLRLEATKALSRVIVTYGIDAYHDRSENRDSSKTTVIGFGPPQTRSSNRPQVPNAALTSYGAFAQGDLRLHEAFSLIVGGRTQRTESQPRVTAGRSDSIAHYVDGTAVYALNGVWRATDGLSVVATLGSGFRSPNLVERYFDGPTPEGSAYQQATPDLKPERSVNVDAGLKYRNARLAAEATIFRNDIRDAIVIAPTGGRRGTLPVYENVNVGRLRAKGIEATATFVLAAGFTASANYTTLSTTNIAQPDAPVGDSYANKFNASLGWSERAGRLWAEYAIRRNGEKKEIAPTASPVGVTLPAFTVHAIRTGVRGWQLGALRQDLTVVINNLTNRLYAEAANASFFRPESGRHAVISISTAF
jgi:hemoglobin/transferrin/lactoferrin receptor protein